MAAGEESIDDVASDLYALAPADFTAARNSAAAKASDSLARRIKGLRKPTVAAWAVNLLVRDGQLHEAAELGAALREAQDELDAQDLAQLGRQRRQLVGSLARRAAELAQEHGSPLSPAAREAVSATVNAAIMDATAAAAILTGRLVKTMEAGDLEGVDLEALVAGTVPGVHVAPDPPRNDLAERRARKAAERAVREAEQAASRADRELSAIEARRTTAQEQADLLHERVEDLRAELERVRADAETADARLEELEDEHRDAVRRAADRHRDADRKRSDLLEIPVLTRPGTT